MQMEKKSFVKIRDFVKSKRQVIYPNPGFES